MRIGKILNATKEQVEKRQFNIFIGISLGNKYFSKERTRKYILWALENTRKDVLVLIADRIHAINYEVFEKYESDKAMSVSLKKGNDLCLSISEILKDLPAPKQRLVKVCRWDEARKAKYYQNKIVILRREFKDNRKFHDSIVNIVAENLGNKTEKLKMVELEILAQYVLDEIPIILNGVEYRNQIYNLHPYPGLGTLDELLMGLQDGKLFPELAKKLEIENQISIAEAYVD